MGISVVPAQVSDHREGFRTEGNHAHSLLVVLWDYRLKYLGCEENSMRYWQHRKSFETTFHTPIITP